jgi:hypothetical protein
MRDVPFFQRTFTRLSFHVWMKVLLWRTLIDREAALAAMNRVPGRGVVYDFRRSSHPLFDMGLTLLALFILDSAHRLSG